MCWAKYRTLGLIVRNQIHLSNSPRYITTMSSGYNDPQKLKDAIALAKSFKSGEFMDKKEGKKKSGFVEGMQSASTFT